VFLFALGFYLSLQSAGTDRVAGYLAVSTRTGIQDVAIAIIREILEGWYSDNITTTPFKANRRDNYDKMKTAYNACMDEEAIKKAGTAPIRAMLDELETVYPLSSSTNQSSSEELTKALIWLSMNSIPTIVSAPLSY
jgi:predicted metalloendopeptidase